MSMINLNLEPVKHRKVSLHLRAIGATVIFFAVVLFLIYGLYPALEEGMK